MISGGICSVAPTLVSCLDKPGMGPTSLQTRRFVGSLASKGGGDLLVNLASPVLTCSAADLYSYEIRARRAIVLGDLALRENVFERNAVEKTALERETSLFDRRTSLNVTSTLLGSNSRLSFATTSSSVWPAPEQRTHVLPPSLRWCHSMSSLRACIRLVRVGEPPLLRLLRVLRDSRSAADRSAHAPGEALKLEGAD